MSKDNIKQETLWQENPWQENPWDVSNIQEFLFYNCPECDIRLKDGKMFVQHALENHELSKLYLNKPIEEILPPDYKEIMRQEARDRMALQNYLNRGGPLTEYEGGPLKEYVDEPPVVRHEVDPLTCPSGELDSGSKEDTKNLAEESVKPKRKREKMAFDCPNCQEQIIGQREVLKHKKMCISSPDSQNSFQIKVESEPANKIKRKGTQNVKTKVQKCPHCNFESELPHVFKLHIKSSRTCTVCNEIFCGARSARKFKSHQNKAHKPPNDCKACNKSFRIASDLKRHYRDSACGRQVDW